MNQAEEDKPCIQGTHVNGVDARTRRVRYLDKDGQERMTTGMCHRHAAYAAHAYRQEGYEGVWTVPVTRSPRETRQPAPPPVPVRMIEVTTDIVDAYRQSTRTTDSPGMILTGLTVAMFARYLEESKTGRLDSISLGQAPATVAELAEVLIRQVVATEKGGARGLIRRCASLLHMEADALEAEQYEERTNRFDTEGVDGYEL